MCNGSRTVPARLRWACGRRAAPPARRGIILPMARIVFTQQLRRFVEAPELDVAAPTLRDALDAVFAAYPRLRGYVLDDQSHLRANVAVFVDGRRIVDRVALADALAPASTVHVMQALSGG
jgi:molybdopterin converting factor small subunit